MKLPKNAMQRLIESTRKKKSPVDGLMETLLGSRTPTAGSSKPMEPSRGIKELDRLRAHSDWLRNQQNQNNAIRQTNARMTEAARQAAERAAKRNR